MASVSADRPAGQPGKTWAVLFHRPVPYAACLRAQEQLVAARLAGDIPDVVLFLEHTPVITLGARARQDHILLSPDQLRARGIDVLPTSRGGDVTYHAPGQLVVYPILHLEGRKANAQEHLRNLEEIGIRTAADWKVEAFRREGLTGVWTPQGKLAAIGVRFRRWTSYHGMSFNVTIDPREFDAIVPCGLAGEPVTSLRVLRGEAAPAIAAVRDSMARRFSDVCGRRLEVFQIGEPLPAPLSRCLAELLPAAK